MLGKESASKYANNCSERETHQLTFLPSQGGIRWNQMDLQQERLMLYIRKNSVVLGEEFERLHIMCH